MSVNSKIAELAPGITPAASIAVFVSGVVNCALAASLSVCVYDFVSMCLSVWVYGSLFLCEF